MTICRRQSKAKHDVFLVDSDTHPQTINVLRTRAEAIGIDLHISPIAEFELASAFGMLISWPSSSGNTSHVSAVTSLVLSAREIGVVSVAATDLLACTLLTPPGQIGFDIAIGSAQRFGVPLWFGGPHAAFMSVRDSHARALPGRLVGVSIDTAGRPALRLSLQTREQHIRREKATSNICTSQALLANVAGFYGTYHGPDGLRAIARRVHHHATIFASSLVASGWSIRHDELFDTVAVPCDDAKQIVDKARAAGFNLRLIDASTVGVSFDEPTTTEEVKALLAVFGASHTSGSPRLNSAALRTDEYMQQSVFHRHHSETDMLRHLRRLADKDLALDRTMIPLGSCTMKLNATSEMEPVSWAEITDLHPFAPDDESTGYRTLVSQLEEMLCAITGYDAVSIQPNAGSQGEFAGLLAIRAYQRARGEAQRVVCLIPSSAHGTNAASAVMAGMRVVVVSCDDEGNVDVSDLRLKIEEHRNELAALMVTYPSTHGVFEVAISDICALVHDAGGQVYVDGANLNALVAVAQPGKFGADVSHLNLHKTFCIPHGGGGPGVGPVAVRAHLADFLPGHPHDDHKGVGPVSAAPFGSAGILPIPWVYIKMMGALGLRRATEDAILSANYVARRLADHFPTLYTNVNGMVAHECILDIRPVTRDTGVTVDDIAKRLMDFCFHAPTISFPVAGTLMVEPTESESLRELDRFCEAMIAIGKEIDAVRQGTSVEESALRHAPHTVEDLTEDWNRNYSRSAALYPVPSLRTRGYFPPVSRIDAAQGDRNLVCTCAPIEAYETGLDATTVSA
jgi:glycine dehydrogenase